MLGFLDVANYLYDALPVGILVRMPEAKTPRFADFWAKADHLQRFYERLFERGRADGEFEFDDLELTTQLLFGIADAPAYWYETRRGTTG